MNSVVSFAQNYKQLPDDWKPSKIIEDGISLDYSSLTTSDNRLTPSRFKKIVAPAESWNTNHTFYKSLIVGSGLISAIAITASSYLLEQIFNVELLSSSNPLFSVSIAIAAVAAFKISAALTYQVISPKITQANLEETFLELKRNPLFLNAYNETTSDGHQIKFETASREAFSHSGCSMAKIIHEKGLSNIKVWDGALPLEDGIGNSDEIYNKYGTKENLIIWSPIAIYPLLFEFCNAFQYMRFEKLVMQAYLAQVSKEGYAINSEFIEFESMILYQDIIHYGFEHLGWERSWFELPPNSSFKKPDKDERIDLFTKGHWPSVNTNSDNKISHAQFFRNQWFKNPLTAWLDQNEQQANAVLEQFRTFTAAEIQDYIINPSNEVVEFPSNSFFYEFYKNEAVVKEFEDMGLKFDQVTVGLESALTFHLVSKRAYLWDYLDDLTKQSQTFTQSNIDISSFEADYKGRCLLRMTQDYLQDMNRHDEKVTVESIKEFLKARRSLILNKTAPLHPMWLLNHYQENKTS